MRRYKCIGSFLLVLSMLAGLFAGTGWISGKVAADDSYPPITNLEVTEHFYVRWDAVDEADSYQIMVQYQNTTMTASCKTNEFDLDGFMKKNGIGSKHIVLRVKAYKSSTSKILAISMIELDYVSSLPKLSKPSNLRIENGFLKWDPSDAPAGSRVEYTVNITPSNRTFYTKECQIPAEYFQTDGKVEYTATIVAKLKDYINSETAEFVFELENDFPSITGLTQRNGVLYWDAFPDADACTLTLHFKNSSSTYRINIETYQGSNMLNINRKLRGKAQPGDTITADVTVCKSTKLNGYQVSINLSKTSSISFVYQEETYPLKIYGNKLSTTSTVLDSIDTLSYYPAENRLHLNGFDLSKVNISAGGSYVAVFESEKPLILSGSGTLSANCTILNVKGGISFAPDSEITIKSYGSAVYADSVSIQGKTLEITSSYADAVYATNGITIAKAAKDIEVSTDTGHSALTCENGKISMSYKKIEVPEGGTVGSDGKHIYMSDGKTVASSVKLVYATPPSVPKVSGVKAAPVSYSTVNVTWNAASGVDGYQVARGTSATGSFTALGSVTGTSRSCTGLTCGNTYYFKVRAYKIVNGTRVYGPYSDAVCVVPVPSAPSGAKAVSASATSANVTWNAVNGANGYQVWRSTSKTGTFTAVGSVHETNRVCSGLTCGTTYYFKVRAYRVVSGVRIYSDFSSVVSVVPKLTAPTGVKTTVSSATAVTVSWNAVSGATGYEVWRATSANGTFSKTGAVTETSRRCPGLTTGKTYYFKVRAYKTVNGEKIYGPYSAVVSGVAK